ncbi:hypothetical protein [Streptomyces filamentosus]|uniref:hypothetical protein n=1 Tax=Streptomyces filamentosus TaxID=67294 RepID=UPI0033D4685C
MSTSAFVRRAYRVPAARGMQITYSGDGLPARTATITGFRGGGLLVRHEGARRPVYAHPTYAITYPPVPNPVGRGWCDGCPAEVGLHADGTVRVHRAFGEECVGVGKRPYALVTWRHNDPVPAAAMAE